MIAAKIRQSDRMHTATYPDGSVITGCDDGILHGVIQDSQDLRGGVSRPMVHQMGGG